MNENLFNKIASNSIRMSEGWEKAKNRINALRGQFRSFNFLPYAALDILTKSLFLPDSYFIIPEAVIPDPPEAIWYIDCFGNAKTTLLPEDVDFSDGGKVAMMRGVNTFPCYQRLADVPDQQAALVVGSSGIGNKRFLEIVVQGGSAAEYFGLEVGQVIIS